MTKKTNKLFSGKNRNFIKKPYNFTENRLTLSVEPIYVHKGKYILLCDQLMTRSVDDNIVVNTRKCKSCIYTYLCSRFLNTTNNNVV